MSSVSSSKRFLDERRLTASRRRVRVAAVLLPLLCAALVAGDGKAVRVADVVDVCSSYGSCAECLFDASDGILSPVHDCAWCVPTRQCVQFNTSSFNVSGGPDGTDRCPDLRHARHNPACSDMMCSAAQTINNVYICRPMATLVVLCACILAVLNLCFYFWMSAIRQLPWKYEPQLGRLLSGEESSVGVGFERKDGAETAVSIHDKQQQQPQHRLLSTCPICKMAQPTSLGPGNVCFWCNIARFGFVPCYIGTTSALLCLVLLFSVSLKPWFADGYYVYLLLSGFVSHAVFAAHVYTGRATHVHMEAARHTLYIRLALHLRGRSLLSVMPLLRENGATESSRSHNVVSPSLQPASVSIHSSSQAQQPHPHPSKGGTFFLEANALSPEEIRQKKGETAQLLNMDYLDQNFRKVLRQTLGRDEYVLWCEKPEVSRVVSFDFWLVIDFAAGVAFGLWLFVVSTIKDPGYVLTRHVTGASMGVIGFLSIVMFGCLLMTTLGSSVRLYVLTDRRLLTVFNGVISPIVAETELRSLRCASVYGHRMCTEEPLLTFSWEVPLMERKLPAMKTHSFPAIVSLKEFLYYFKAVAPTSLSIREQTRQGMRHRRKVWRMHLFLCIAVFQFLPVIIFYPLLVPSVLSFLLFVIVSAVVLATVYRGACIQHMTHASLSLAGNWAEVGLQRHSSSSPRDMAHFLQSCTTPLAGAPAKDKFGTNGHTPAAAHAERLADGASRE